MAMAGAVLLGTTAMEYAKGDHGWAPIVGLIAAAIILIEAAYFWWKDRA